MHGEEEGFCCGIIITFIKECQTVKKIYNIMSSILAMILRQF